MGQLTGYIGVVTSQPTMKWWANGLANSAVMGWPTGYIGVMTSRPMVCFG